VKRGERTGPLTTAGEPSPSDGPCEFRDAVSRDLSRYRATISYAGEARLNIPMRNSRTGSRSENGNYFAKRILRVSVLRNTEYIFSSNQNYIVFESCKYILSTILLSWFPLNIR